MLYKYRFDSEELLEDLDEIVAEAERQQIEPQIEHEDDDWVYERDGESVWCQKQPFISAPAVKDALSLFPVLLVLILMGTTCVSISHLSNLHSSPTKSRIN